MFLTSFLPHFTPYSPCFQAKMRDNCRFFTLNSSVGNLKTTEYKELTEWISGNSRFSVYFGVIVKPKNISHAKFTKCASAFRAKRSRQACPSRSIAFDGNRYLPMTRDIPHSCIRHSSFPFFILSLRLCRPYSLLPSSQLFSWREAPPLLSWRPYSHGIGWSEAGR